MVKTDTDGPLSKITCILLMLAVVGGLVLAMTARHVNEDLFLSLAAGRDIVQGHLTSPEFRSFTAEGRIWVNQAWLSHLLYFNLFRILGPFGPVLIKGVLLVGTVVLVLIRCRALGVSMEFSLLGLWAGMIAAIPLLGNRPENFGVFFFLSLTPLLTLTRVPRPLRLLTIPTILALWSNCHGSFMLGLGLLGMKSVLETGRNLFPKILLPLTETSRRNAVEWWCLLGASLVAVIVCSPFGFQNLIMPFTQLGTSQVTAHSRDWLPLWSHQIDRTGFLEGGSVYPYLVMLVMAAIAMITVVARRLRGTPLAAKEGEINADLVMEAIVVLVIVLFAFRFKRMILFSAFSLVPLVSLAWQWAVAPLQPRDDTFSSRPFRRKLAASIGAALLCIFTGLVCYRAGLFPYFQGNPYRPDRSVVRELMSFDSYSPSLIEFLKQNKINGRVLSGWEISPYLMFYLPELRLFMDCRDQSLYSEQVIRDYLTILGVLPRTGGKPLSLLDAYKVSTVVLTTEPTDFDCAVYLMKTKKWACIYADENSFVLLRSDSELIRKALASDDGNELRYPNSETKALSRSYLAHFMLDGIPRSLVSCLKDLARENPVPNYYAFITSGMDDERSCFKVETVQYLMKEATRLSLMTQEPSRKARLARESLERIYQILEANAVRCGNPQSANRFAILKNQVESENERKRDRYLGKFL